MICLSVKLTADVLLVSYGMLGRPGRPALLLARKTQRRHSSDRGLLAFKNLRGCQPFATTGVMNGGCRHIYVPGTVLLGGGAIILLLIDVLLILRP